MIITISGTPGSGKSTLGRLLAKNLKYKFLSMGDIRRKYAKDRGLSLEELNEEAKSNPESDNLVDEYLQALKNEDKLVIDSRLAYHFIPQSFKLFVDADRVVRAKRIHEHNREEESYEERLDVMKRNEERAEEDRQRYHKLYSIKDYRAEKNFDLLLDSTKKSPEQLLNEVLKAINLKKR